MRRSRRILAEKTAAANNLNELILEMEQLETRFAEALTELPEGKDIDELLAQFHDIGRQVGLQIDKVEPAGEKADPSAPFVSALPVKMSVEGSYHEVALFLQEVARLKRIVNVSNVKFSSPKLQGGSKFPATNTSTVRAAGLAPVVAGASQELATPAAGLTAQPPVTALRGDKVLVKTEFVATAYRFVAVTDAPQGQETCWTPEVGRQGWRAP